MVQPKPDGFCTKRRRGWGFSERTDPDCERDPPPLSLKNTDNKFVASVYNSKLSGPVAKSRCKTQQGFVRDGQPLSNPVVLDDYARRHSYPSDWPLWPLYVFYDFAAAFPSVFREWILAVLKHIGCPQGILNVIEALYDRNTAYVRAADALVLLFEITSGVLQGCPLSGSIFAICVDPFLRWMSWRVDERHHGLTRACADDIGQALKSITTLKVVEPIFRCAKEVAGLSQTPPTALLCP